MQKTSAIRRSGADRGNRSRGRAEMIKEARVCPTKTQRPPMFISHDTTRIISAACGEITRQCERWQTRAKKQEPSERVERTWEGKTWVSDLDQIINKNGGWTGKNKQIRSRVRNENRYPGPKEPECQKRAAGTYRRDDTVIYAHKGNDKVEEKTEMKSKDGELKSKTHLIIAIFFASSFSAIFIFPQMRSNKRRHNGGRGRGGRRRRIRSSRVGQRRRVRRNSGCGSSSLSGFPRCLIRTAGGIGVYANMPRELI